MPETVLSTKFSDTTRPKRNPAGVTVEVHSQTIPTTSLDAAGDKYGLIPLPDGVIITKLFLTHADLDSGAGALDMDIVLVDDAGDTVLLNYSTAFNAAVTAPVVVLLNQTVTASTTYATAGIYLKVVTAASTAAAGNVTLHAEYVGRGAGY